MNGSFTSLSLSMTRNPDKPTPQTIADLSLGDKVIFMSGIPGAIPEVASVEKVMAAKIVVRGNRFHREEDVIATAIGGGNLFTRARIRIGEPDEIAKMAAENLKRRQIARLQNTDWEKISPAIRNGIIRILNNPENFLEKKVCVWSGQKI